MELYEEDKDHKEELTEPLKKDLLKIPISH